MKNGTLIFVVSTLLLFCSSCSDSSWDSEVEQFTHSSSLKKSSKDKKDKCDICHYQESKGTYKKKNISCGNAIQAHINHGDGLIGDAVPGQDGFVFGEECELIQVNVECPCFDKDQVLSVLNGTGAYCDSEDIAGIFYSSRNGVTWLLQDMQRLSCYHNGWSDTSPAQQDVCLSLLQEGISEHLHRIVESENVCGNLRVFSDAAFGY